MLFKILNWEEFRTMCYEDAYNWHDNGYTADELTAEDILNEYPDDYFTEEFQEIDELSHCFTPEEVAEQTLEYLRIISSKAYIDKVKELAESKGWNAEIYDDTITFQTYTTYGQDCYFTLDIAETAEDFCKSLYDYYDGFDVSTETYYWLDSDGHGKNGAPYDMMDVYNDMAEYEAKIEELWKTVSDAF